MNLHKKFVVPALLAIFSVMYPLCFIFRTSEATWKMSAIGHIPTGLWALSIPLYIVLYARAHKKVAAAFKIEDAEAEKKEKEELELDRKYYNNLSCPDNPAVFIR